MLLARALSASLQAAFEAAFFILAEWAVLLADWLTGWLTGPPQWPCWGLKVSGTSGRRSYVCRSIKTKCFFVNFNKCKSELELGKKNAINPGGNNVKATDSACALRFQIKACHTAQRARARTHHRVRLAIPSRNLLQTIFKSSFGSTVFSEKKPWIPPNLFVSEKGSFPRGSSDTLLSLSLRWFLRRLQFLARYSSSALSRWIQCASLRRCAARALRAVSSLVACVALASEQRHIIISWTKRTSKRSPVRTSERSGGGERSVGRSSLALEQYKHEISVIADSAEQREQFTFVLLCEARTPWRSTRRPRPATGTPTAPREAARCLGSGPARGPWRRRTSVKSRITNSSPGSSSIPPSAVTARISFGESLLSPEPLGLG